MSAPAIIEKNSQYTIACVQDHPQLNEQIVSGYKICRDSPDEQTHFFHGRFENTYIAPARIEGLTQLLRYAREMAAQLLGLEIQQLKDGFWFNEMQPGHVTSRHNHEEDDELLSCVYYLDAPENSGDLMLYLEDEDKRIEPRAGMFVFFSPQLEHEVGRNESTVMRLSLAMNFGPRI